MNSLEVEAIAEDEAADVKVTGNDNLLMGENTVEITVTAEDGTVKTYKIYVTKGEEASLGLSELTVEGYTLNPEFSTDIYEYTLDVTDTSITSLNVQAISNVENAEVEIVGNTDMKVGKNVITILVKSENDEIATYQIVVNITEPTENQIIAGIDNNKLFLYGGIGLVAIIILIIIIVVIRRRKKNNNDDEPYYGGFTSLNKSDDKEKNNVVKESNSINKKNEVDKMNIDSFENDEKAKKRKSVIEENFGADIDTKNMNFYDDNTTGRKKGKHF